MLIRTNTHEYARIRTVRAYPCVFVRTHDRARTCVCAYARSCVRTIRTNTHVRTHEYARIRTNTHDRAYSCVRTIRTNTHDRAYVRTHSLLSHWAQTKETHTVSSKELSFGDKNTYPPEESLIKNFLSRSHCFKDQFSLFLLNMENWLVRRDRFSTPFIVRKLEVFRDILKYFRCVKMIFCKYFFLNVFSY